jgi:hypothetical protein
MGKINMDMQLLVKMGCFISEYVDEDGDNSSKDVKLVDLIIV